jgi:protein-disulfide isomerase
MKLGRLILLAAAAAFSLAAAPPRPANWNNALSQTAEGGVLVGNPNAQVKLIEYVSYTCPHCAHFEIEASGPLQLTFITGGKGSIEYRSLIRNKIDVVVSLLVTCGPISRFRANHAAFLRGQDKWFTAPGPGAERRWEANDFPTAARAIANDLKLYDIMQNRGYTRPEIDRCLTNRAAADKLAAQTQKAVKLGVDSTPSFLVNGQLLDVHDWDGLRPRLMELTR